jgi:hypothetical protein
MLRFRSQRTLQKFVAVHTSIYNHFNMERHLYSRQNFKANRTAPLLLPSGLSYLRPTTLLDLVNWDWFAFV